MIDNGFFSIERALFYEKGIISNDKKNKRFEYMFDETLKFISRCEKI